ncbi:mannose-6-phosphate isomerase [Apiospora arundinis]
MDALKEDLPMSMTMAAFSGIAWYIGLELNFTLFVLFKRWRGLYFWSCALESWGVILQPLFIILADFGVWTDLKGSIVMIYLTVFLMVVPQSWVLFSRLHLLTHNTTLLRYIRLLLLFTSVVLPLPTIVIGTLTQATAMGASLEHANMIWDRVQVTIFLAQESLLSLLYIHETRKHLRLVGFVDDKPGASLWARRDGLFLHLIGTNLLVIVFDVTLLGIEYAGLFYLQGAFKPCVYGIKLKVEFLVLNRLVKSLEHHRRSSNSNTGALDSGRRRDGSDSFPLVLHPSRSGQVSSNQQYPLASRG